MPTMTMYGYFTQAHDAGSRCCSSEIVLCSFVAISSELSRQWLCVSRPVIGHLLSFMLHG